MYFGDIFIYGLFILVACAIALFACWWISDEFFKIAVAKGYKDRKYFWFCFFFTFAGFLLVMALPDKTNTTVNVETNTTVEDELPEI